MNRKPYARTDVAPAQSRGEIEAALRRYNVREFGFMHAQGAETLLFTHRGRTVKIAVVVKAQPSPKEQDQEERRMWRVARAWVLAQLEAVESGLIEWEEAFFSQTVTDDGRTAYQRFLPALPEPR